MTDEILKELKELHESSTITNLVLFGIFLALISLNVMLYTRVSLI